MNKAYIIYFKIVFLLACSCYTPIFAMTEMAENERQNQAVEEPEQEIINNKPTNTKKRKLKKQTSMLKNIALGGTVVVGAVALGGMGIYLAKKSTAKTGFTSPTSNTNPPLPGQPSRILGFYRDEIGVTADDRNNNKLMTWRNVIDELTAKDAYNSTLFEGSHHFIQWLFPLYQAGKNPNAETWTTATVDQFKSDHASIDRIIRSFQVVVHGYYKLNVNITQGTTRDQDVVIVSIDEAKFDQTVAALTIHDMHNTLRITRIIKCLKILGLENYATAFNVCLQAICLKLNIDTNDRSLDESAKIWDLAAPQNPQSILSKF
ncbi:MAG: hypothetical protein US49_C0005G0011 [candidate division TM6 bacterium GW2011_GWF2_37_49]|nr:MAG: hypothetical protein US49_C0005G0011 [candidate division TM6 bacterium GW2011_GWF2_37_49]